MLYSLLISVILILQFFYSLLKFGNFDVFLKNTCFIDLPFFALFLFDF